MKRFALALIALIGLAACGTSPEPDLYMLAAIPGTVMPDTATTIVIHRPTIAAYLDRPDFVRQVGQYDVQIDEMKRWAEPTDRMFARILAEDLQQRLPASTIVTDAMPQPDVPHFTIDLNLQQFNARDARRVVLAGNYLLVDKQTPSMPPQPFLFNANSGWSVNGAVAGLSDVTAQLADRIAAQLAERLNPPRKTAP